MKVEQFAQLDAGTRARVESACAFVNHKVEEARRRVKTTAVIAGIGALIWWLTATVDWRWPLIAAVVITSAVHQHQQRGVRRWYKMLVIRRVVDALGHGLAYTHESSLTKAQLKDMDLFLERFDVFNSEDQVTGKRREIDFELHEVRAAQREQRGKRTVEVVFFKGLVVRLEFNKNFAGHTIVVPDKDGKRLGGLFGESESRGRKQIVRLADADFENTYTVYSTNDQEAHYLLTPKLMELVLRARQRLDAQLRLAFVNNTLFVTVPSHHDRFEVSLFGREVTPYTAIGELADVVKLAEELIDLLDLETRIWTRV